MNTKVMFSSLSDEWRTPQSLFNKLDKEFNFDSDPCPMKDKPLKSFPMRYWGYRVFINPPYSKIKEWVRLGYEHSKKNRLVVMLIPSRTDTKYWHDYIMKADEIRFIKGRLKFSGHKNPAPFPSCIVIFKSE